MSYNKKITLPILQYYDSKIKPYISNLISNHNSATNSHSDIRTKLSNDEKKLNTIATGAEVNQNAFSTVNVTSGGSSTAVNAASKTASLGLTAGNNVTLGTSGSTVTVNSAQRNVTSSLTSTSDTTGLSASAGKNLQDQITTLNSNLSDYNILHPIYFNSFGSSSLSFPYTNRCIVIFAYQQGNDGANGYKPCFFFVRNDYNFSYSAIDKIGESELELNSCAFENGNVTLTFNKTYARGIYLKF